MSWSELGPLLGQALGQTLYMVVGTLLVGGVLGLVLGVALYVSRPRNLLPNRAVAGVLNVLVNTVRPIPFIIFVTAVQPAAIAVTGTSYGPTYALFAMAVMATFATSRIVEQNLVALDPGVVEAARAMGAGPVRIITTVLIPEALGPLILGYTFLFVAIVDMSAVVGAVAGGGLGNFAIVYGYQRYDYAVTWLTVAVIVVIVQLAQALGNLLARRVLRR
ncbi:MAG: methionine ABC transporter ATP-binding protein [Cellulomonas sp. 73-145]|uniref:methionine ABC transporter permease n=1 Tax=Cellulomonas sp. 73-145 TaxID=1895739 RepID=UPI00092C3CC0|nr:methionine ABC transporter permease [Cellulomonas sp. 73-145]OJV58093.1 MAG: methionine ABC transporter ATP-binding protein [Cellulomonas sp. 73-145]